MQKPSKIYLDDTLQTYTFKEIPGAVITDIAEEDTETGMHVELLKIQYDGCTEFVVISDKKGRGNTLQYKTEKTAQKKYDAFIAEERKDIVALLQAAEETAEDWEGFKKEALTGYKQWKRV